MKIGIQVLSYNCSDTFEELIQPWVKLKNKYDIKIWVGSGQFKIYNDMGCVDNNEETIILLKKLLKKGDIDYLFQPDPDNLLGDHTTRDKSISWLRDNDIDLMIQLDSDEFYTDEEVNNYLNFIMKNKEYDAYRTNFLNVVGDGELIDWERFSAAWIKRYGGISHYYYDAHWSFKGVDGENIEYRRVNTITVPKELVNPLHKTWTNELNTTGPNHIKDKIEYQKKYYNGECGYIWDDDKKKIKRKNNIYEDSLKFYKDNINVDSQLEDIVNILTEHFNFFKINCIETGTSHNINDGCVGLFFNKICELSGGEFHTVDIDSNLIEKSKEFYKKYGQNNVIYHIMDSVEFLKNIDNPPNLIHLDSMDLNLKNPIPSMYHGFEEFKMIENKMPIGSIIIIDDNFFKGTWVDWNTNNGSERINIDYPIVGKGSLVYYYVESMDSDWVKVSVDKVGVNNKIVFKKIK